jgi:hypothetical protein
MFDIEMMMIIICLLSQTLGYRSLNRALCAERNKKILEPLMRSMRGPETTSVQTLAPAPLIKDPIVMKNLRSKYHTLI